MEADDFEGCVLIGAWKNRELTLRNDSLDDGFLAIVGTSRMLLLSCRDERKDEEERDDGFGEGAVVGRSTRRPTPCHDYGAGRSLGSLRSSL